MGSQIEVQGHDPCWPYLLRQSLLRQRRLPIRLSHSDKVGQLGGPENDDFGMNRQKSSQTGWVHTLVDIDDDILPGFASETIQRLGLGLGKTLLALSMIALNYKEGCGPSIIVAPLSCCQQWMYEIAKFFEPDTLNSICLVGEQASPVQLYKYSVVVTSYQQVAAEVSRAQRFLAAIKASKKGELERKDLPKRSSLLCCLASWSSLARNA
ncbi:hypothetical protein ACHAPJ_004333 [Fusarium lateritium]